MYHFHVDMFESIARTYNGNSETKYIFLIINSI